VPTQILFARVGPMNVLDTQNKIEVLIHLADGTQIKAVTDDVDVLQKVQRAHKRSRQLWRPFRPRTFAISDQGKVVCVFCLAAFDLAAAATTPVSHIMANEPNPPNQPMAAV